MDEFLKDETMIKWFPRVILVLSIFAPITLYAANSGWSGKAKITSLYAVSETQVLIKLTSFTNPMACAVTEAGDILINPTTQKTWYNLVLAAHMAGREIDVYIYGDCQTVHWVGPSFGGIGHLIVH
jgi:hypothetical protein